MRAELSFLTASVVINAAMLYSVDHAALHYEKNLAASRAQQLKIPKKGPSGPIAFEFVEAPKAPARKPVSKTSRISDRDAIDQGAAKTLGPADQLAQKKGKPAPPAAPEVKPQTAQPEKQEVAVKQQVKEEAPLPGEILLKQEPPPQKYSPPVTAAQPSPTSPPAEAQDRITTSEMSKKRSRGAQIYGLTSFEATGSGMGVYMKNLKEKIWLAWFPYLVTHYPRDYKSADAVVSFKLNANGDVKIVELIDSKGSPLFASFCMEAIQRAGTFGPLPKEILALVGKDELEIKFAFHYW